jgi:glutaredoxin
MKARIVMLRRITVVLAPWCPHCVPLSLEKAQQMAKELNVELRVLDIDKPDQEKLADTIVQEHGDFAEDYLIPQVFLELDDGSVKHIFTGFSEGVHITKARWDDFFASHFYGSEVRSLAIK